MKSHENETNRARNGGLAHLMMVDATNSSNKGILYIVSTHIGNPQDITHRAIQVLRAVKIIAAEDSRVIGPMLAQYDIGVEVCSLRQTRRTTGVNTLDRIAEALSRGEDVALVSDSGTPLIADPGASIVKAAHEMQCRVISVPGAVAAIAAITSSGLSSQRFTFDGFPPRAKADRYKFFSSLAVEKRTIVLYETRSHIRNTLRCLANCLGDNRQIAVMRDITRATEAMYKGSIKDVAQLLGGSPLRGEYVLVIDKKSAEQEQD
jgi:16S rRNA (cytidine1402-2'-O)-methyltransferase